MGVIKSRDEWLFNNSNQFNLDALIRMYEVKMLNITQQIFEYENLPETIPKKDLELILQKNGCVTIAKKDDKLYAFAAGLGGKPNVYYLPTLAIIANPALNYTAQLEIDRECVVILNDALYQGLFEIIEKNAYLLAQCDISFKFAAVNTRIPALITATTAKTKAEAEILLNEIELGEQLGIIGGNNVLESLKVYNYANSSTMVQHLIELKQYIVGTFYQTLGIQSQFNMKREAINEAEASLSTDILYPLIDEMLEQRRIGIDKVNKMFGTNIIVKLSSVWSNLRNTRNLEIKLTESEIIKNIGDGEGSQGDDNDNDEN